MIILIPIMGKNLSGFPVSKPRRSETALPRLAELESLRRGWFLLPKVPRHRVGISMAPLAALALAWHDWCRSDLAEEVRS